MSQEEKDSKKTELNNELNTYKRKWNVVSTNMQTWKNVGSRMQRSENKSKRTFAYHTRKFLTSLIIAVAASLLPYSFPIVITFSAFSINHLVRMVICGYCALKFKKVVTITDRISNKYSDKKQEIEQKQEHIYQQINKIEKLEVKAHSKSLINQCIERTSISSAEELQSL